MKLRSDLSVKDIGMAMAGVDRRIGNLQSENRLDAAAQAFGGAKPVEAKPARGRKLGL